MSELSQALIHVLVDELVEREGRLSEELAQRFEEQGERAVGPLVEVLTDDDSWRGRHPRLAVSAARLLAATGSPRAARPLLEALLRAWKEELRERPFLKALGALGEPMVDPTLRRLARTFDEDARNLLAEALAHSGVRHTRIRTWLLGLLETDPGLAASLLARYGDERVIPDLVEALEAAPATDSARVRELADAITDLGGTLTAAHQDKYERSIQIAEQVRVPTLIPFGDTGDF